MENSQAPTYTHEITDGGQKRLVCRTRAGVGVDDSGTEWPLSTQADRPDYFIRRLQPKDAPRHRGNRAGGGQRTQRLEFAKAAITGLLANGEGNALGGINTVSIEETISRAMEYADEAVRQFNAPRAVEVIEGGAVIEEGESASAATDTLSAQPEEAATS